MFTRRLHILATNNANYDGCDFKTCYFACVKGATFQSVIVGGIGWLDLERPLV
jgi:hypothetical protein